MSTLKQLKVMKNMPYQLRVRAEGYFDIASDQTFYYNDTYISEEMTEYNGLAMSYEDSYQSADKVDFSNTVLPWAYQYSTSLATDRFCLMPVGQSYENVTGAVWVPSTFTVTGSVTITDKIASGFSTSNYISLQNSVFLGSDFEIGGKFKTSSDVTTEQNVAAGQTNQYFGLSIQNGAITFNVGDGSQWLNPTGSKSASANTEYWYKAIYNNGQYSLEISEDGVNYTQTHSLTSSTVIPAFILRYGISRTGASPFLGEIDLSESYIKINGSTVWAPEWAKTSSGVAETLPGCTYNFTDDGSATTLNCFAVNGDEGIVLTPDNSYNIPPVYGNVWQGSINFDPNPESYIGYMEIYDSNSDIKWAWDKKFDIVGSPTITTEDDNCTVVVSAGNYIRTKTAFAPEEGDTFDCSLRFTYHAGQKQILASSNGFEIGVDDDGHPYGTFYGIGTATVTDVTLSNGDNSEIVWWYMDGEYLVEGYDGEGNPFDASFSSDEVIKSGKINFGQIVKDGQSGWLLGTVSIPSHTVYEYDNGTWTEA